MKIKNGLIYIIGSDCLGRGEQELGQNLMKTFFYSQSEADTLPQAFLFINDGIKLTIKNSQVLDYLKALELSGVEILSCGACLNYHNCEADLAVGGITNMYSIVEMINEGENVISL